MSFSNLLETVIDKKIKNICQIMVGTIEKYDEKKLRATVKLLYNTKNSEGKEIAYPLLSNIPVLKLGGETGLRPFYEKDDLVIVGFSTFDFQKQLEKTIASESSGLFGKENSFVLGSITSKKFENPESYEKKGTVLNNGEDSDIVLTENSIKLRFKNSILEINETGIFAEVNGFKINVVKHGHTTVLGPTIPPIIPEVG